MRKSNWLYVIYHSFTSDLLFWIVIDNLFLTTVKGFNAFQIVLVTMLGLAFSLILYPITNYIVKKTNNKTSIVLGSLCYVIAISLFMICNTILGFVIAQTFYNMSSPFRMVSNVMLKNNLEDQNKQEDYVKWQSHGKLGYSIITLIVALFAGAVFNVNSYLPTILSLVCAIIGLILSFIYSDSNIKEEKELQGNQIMTLFKNKTMLLIMLMNIVAVGTYVFLQSKATLLIQYVCEDVDLDLAKISLIVSGIVFGSRICRVLANMMYPKIYNKTKNKSNILIAISMLILFSNLCFVVGGNLFSNYIIRLVIITIGFYVILSVRDMYAVTENKILTMSIPSHQQKQAFVLANIYGKLGRLVSNAFALVVLGFMPLNILYAFMLIFAVGQIFICIPLSKYFKMGG